MSEPVRTALFGGTFNPLHNGHIAIAKSVIEQGLADELWLMVTPCNPWKKGKQLLDDQLRYSMACEAVKGLEGIKASDYEFNLPIPSYSADTLRRITVDYPDRQFILTIGADNWERFDRWHDNNYIIENFPIIIYPRTGSVVGELPQGVTLLDCPLIDISSTQIVDLIKKGRSIKKMVPATVAATIKELKLFR
ncbi:MAG: nicotinate-nucleotide adenylyltransferase [Bacteroidaceae bacterium]|nr:nicotinate-nucleotide adenylyltransferase [Bacteroidaceae bacterium]